MSLAATFFRIFGGLDRAHGTYVIPPDAQPDAKGKIKGLATTHPYKNRQGEMTDGTVTLSMWERHLEGSYPLGIVPIRDDASCVFGAIDVDVYPLDLNVLVERCAMMRVPLVVCRTKSGGAHLYAFTKEPVPAILMRQKLTQWRDALGYGPRIVNGKHVQGSEIFPKQDRLIERSDIGNWINMPYFAGEHSLRYAIGKRALSPVEFVMYYDKAVIADANALQAIQHLPIAIDDDEPAGTMHAAERKTTEKQKSNVPNVQHELLPGAPPCLTYLATAGVPDGTNNNFLFNVAVYLKKRLPDGEWQEELRRLGHILSPSQKKADVEPMIRTMLMKSYGYKCKDTPICDVCDKKECAKRTYGVGGGATLNELELVFGRMDKVMTKPVMWLWEIDGELVDFETESLMNQKLFQGRVMEILNRWPPTIKPFLWREFIQETVQNSSTIVVPDDATADGQLMDFLQRFCTSRVAGKNIDELLLGKPFTDEDRSYFVVSDLVTFLIQNRFPNKVNERIVYISLSKHDLRHHQGILKDKPMKYWSLPAFKSQIKEHAVPAAPPREAM